MDKPPDDVATQETVSDATLVPAPGDAAKVVLPPPGYDLGNQLGRGGMGEVLAATDLRIGREVAVKRMLHTHPDNDQITRFLREARVQARLDHPAIVPVHELGLDIEGRPYFTMKRLVGKTLGQRMREGLPLNRLLRAYVDICHAIELAHARGVVHRDLKPSNVMLGDYGEVYVLDWGIARVLQEDQEMALRTPEIDTVNESTRSDELLGTPGYMAPEQIHGKPATPATDVYALGAILFELLTGEQLHPIGTKGIASTLGNPQELPSSRRPEKGIAPELDAVCFEALAEDPQARPKVHDLAERVEAFLDGDRDLLRRREMGEALMREAHALLAEDGPDARASAMRRAGRALALDPASEDAAQVVSTLLLTPPHQLPPDCKRGLEEEERKITRDRSKKGVLVYLSTLLLVPFVLLLEVKDWSLVIGFFALNGLGALASWQFYRAGRVSVPVLLVLHTLLALIYTRLAGPFVLTPLMICASIVAISSIPWFGKRPVVVLSWAAFAVLAPIALEWLGVLPKTWDIANGRMTIISDVIQTSGMRDELALTATNLMFTLVLALFALAINTRRRAVQQQAYVQAWHLRQLLPNGKQPWTALTR